MSKPTILITGVAGFIGSSVANYFLSRNFSVIGIDNLSTGNSNKTPKDLVFIKGDLSEDVTYSLIPDLVIHTIIHIAGQSGGIPSWEDNINDLKNNSIAGLKLINFAIERKIKNFLYTSSMSVYGNPVNQPTLESDLLNPLTPYAITKLTIEYYLRIYKEYFQKVHILRLNNVYGPGQELNNHQQGMIRIFLNAAIFHKRIEVLGDLNRYRDFVYISDVVQAIFLSCESKNNGFHVLNVSTNKKTYVHQILELIQKNLPFKIEIVVNLIGTKGDQKGIFCDNSEATRILEWTPAISIEEGIKMTIQSMHLEE